MTPGPYTVKPRLPPTGFEIVNPLALVTGSTALSFYAPPRKPMDARGVIERLVANGTPLATMSGIQVLNDRRVPGTRRNIDHIVIAPAGVFVVDAKRYQGQIAIRNRGWLLRPDYRLTIGGRDKSKLARDMGWQVDAVAGALRAAGVEPQPPITPVL